MLYRPRARMKPEGEGAVIDHKSHGYSAVVLHPNWFVWLVVQHANKLVVTDHKSHYKYYIYIPPDWSD